MREIIVEPLSAEAFDQFGTVIEAGRERGAHSINDGSCLKFANLASPDCSADGGKAAIHLYRAKALPKPIILRSFERHALGSQMFMPLGGKSFLIAVAPKGIFNVDEVRVFESNGSQGIQFYRGTWHHFCLALENETEFLVIDRIAGAEDCETIDLDGTSALKVLL